MSEAKYPYVWIAQMQNGEWQALPLTEAQHWLLERLRIDLAEVPLIVPFPKENKEQRNEYNSQKYSMVIGSDGQYRHRNEAKIMKEQEVWDEIGHIEQAMKAMYESLDSISEGCSHPDAESIRVNVYAMKIKLGRAFEAKLPLVTTIKRYFD